MTIKLHRCGNQWVKLEGHPCWKVEKALIDMKVEYTLAPGPVRKSKRDDMVEHTGQKLYPAIEFEDGTWYRAESKDMEKAIRERKLREHAQAATAPTSG